LPTRVGKWLPGGMPRINAPTVAEHRARQRAAILAAARSQLGREGYGGLTFSALARETGLARTSLYEYFESRAAIVVALSEDGFPPLIERIESAVAAADDPLAKVTAFIRAQMEWGAEDPERLATTLAAPALPDHVRAQLRDLHAGMQPPLVRALEAAGDAHADRTVALIQGIVNAAILRLVAGDDAVEVTDAALALASDGLRRELAR
jgi:AcrR family transcriptional regulator